MRMDDQPEIEAAFAERFEACEKLIEFARAHRPARAVAPGQTPIVHWTLARSDRTFKTIVKLCRLGYGQQAAMLNRTLFEDMISAHWAARRPASAARLMRWHDEYARVRRAAIYRKHRLRFNAELPRWWGKRRKRMDQLFRRGTWTGRSVPRMVEQVQSMWPEGAERDRLNRMHDVIHQGFNMLMHHSARSLSLGYSADEDGNVTFALGPSTALVALCLGFAFWTYANTLSLTVEGDALRALSELVTRYDHVVPDRSIIKLLEEAEEADDADAAKEAE